MANPAWGAVRWTMPGMWNAGPDLYLVAVSSDLLVFLAVLQLVLLGGLFWGALYRMRRRTLPAVMLVAACAAVTAAVLTGLASQLLLAEPIPYVERPVYNQLVSALNFVPGALTMGLLGGLGFTAETMTAWWTMVADLLEGVRDVLTESLAQGGMDNFGNRCNDSAARGLPRCRHQLLSRPGFEERLPRVRRLDTVHGLP
jgi:hypothetical protein